jgi:hypothetical protein
MKKIILALFSFVAIGAAVGYYMYNKPVDKMAQMAVSDEVSAEDLFSAYEKDEAEANRKYLDKIILVKGKVLKSEEGEEKTTILLDTGDMLANIMCQMENKKLTLPEPNSIISIKGLCTGYLTDVVLVRAVIVD